jgi:hopanoid-associated phosphorylase
MPTSNTPLATAAAVTTAGKPLIILSGLAFEARIAAGTRETQKPSPPNAQSVSDTIIVCGLGSSVLAQRLSQAAAQGCCGILSFGTAAGLAPMLQPGDCVLAETIIGHTETDSGIQRWHTDPAWLAALHAALPHARRGIIAGLTEPIRSAAAKQNLYQTSAALAADMESHWGARIAQQYGVPFAACRVIVDSAQRSLPLSATAGLQPDGRTALLPILRALAAHPAELFALLALARDARAAQISLKKIRAQVGKHFACPFVCA